MLILRAEALDRRVETRWVSWGMPTRVLETRRGGSAVMQRSSRLPGMSANDAQKKKSQEENVVPPTSPEN
jgi:hypothetical protein